MDKNKLKDGTVIFNYEDKTHEYRLPAKSLYCDEVEKHFNKVFPNRNVFVFHEIFSDLIHVDIFVMEPNEEEDFYVLFTTGMSDLPMSTPKGLEDYERTELMIFLPKDWNIRSDKNEDYWPISVMKFLARFPHINETWLWHGHTVQNGPDYDTYASNTGFRGVLLVALDEEISCIRVNEEKKVLVHMMVPLYKEEMDYKLEYGLDLILDKLSEQRDNPYILDIKRDSVV